AALAATLLGKDALAAINAAQMVDTYNRQLHPDERKLIRELAKQKAIESCNGKPSCIDAETIRWTDALERVAESRADDEEFAKHAAYLAALERTAQMPGTEGSMGTVAEYLDDLKTANEMLAPYFGKPIVVNGQTVTLDGAPQTYFSATAEQRANTTGNYPLGFPPDPSIIPGMANRDQDRLEYAATPNGSAQPVYPVEELLLGGMVSERILGLLGRALSTAGQAGASTAAKGGTTNSISRIATPYGDALQSADVAAIAARKQVEEGATLYRIGTTGKSQAAEAQFWSLENPSSPSYAARYGIPAENISNANFIETATLKPGTGFVTRPAPAVGANPGGGIEVVVPSGGVQMIFFSTIK
ncbi:hypothetical protein, partial [Azonexus hydrophilus]|uniref:hypothetical protein n=1 Tax=Azonexus hydrophilus TaxID=418702 RepID=UPI001964AC95